jgi:CDP-4-dehydro-6-deoxyglucose reductase
MFSYEVISIKPLAASVQQIFLRPFHLPVLAYSAGQYVHIIHQDQMQSPLSIANAANVEGLLEFHLFHAANRIKAHDLIKMAEQEKVWHFNGPHGVCTVEHLDLHKPIIFLARGTGFAPIKAVIEALQKKKHYPPLYFYWSVKTEADLYLQDLLTTWSHHLTHFTYRPIFTNNEDPALPLTSISQEHPDLSHYQIYASGPKPLMESAWHTFQKQGLPSNSFFSDVLTV